MAKRSRDIWGSRSRTSTPPWQSSMECPRAYTFIRSQRIPDKAWQGPIIATFLYPEGKHFDFQEMYAYIKERGYAIYPGKLTDADTFRIGVIGEIYEEDVLRLTEIMKSYMEQA